MESKMNLYRRDFIALSTTVLGVAAIGLFPSARLARAQATSIGRVTRSAGVVEIIHGDFVQSGAVEAPVSETDQIRTGADGRAEITFSDGSVLTVGPESEIAISTFAPAAGESNAVLDLLSGIVRVTVNKATEWGRFEVRTSTAVASVRGTEYLVEDTGVASAVFVAEGRVAVSSRTGSGTVIIRAGQGVDVNSEFTPLKVKTWGAKRRDAALARVTFP